MYVDCEFHGNREPSEHSSFSQYSLQLCYTNIDKCNDNQTNSTTELNNDVFLVCK